MYVRTGRRSGHGRAGLKRQSMYKGRGAARFKRVLQRSQWRGPTTVYPVMVSRGRRMFNIEKKFHDLDIVDATIAAGGTIAQPSCNLIPQGVTEVTRVGRKATIKSINWRFNISTVEQDGVANPLDSDTVRVILYLDKQANGAAAAVTDILETDDFQSFNNLANKSRFRTLMDRTYTINVEAGGGDGVASDWASTRVDDTFFKKVNIPIEFDSTTGALTEIRSNNIGVLLLGVSATTVFDSKMRLRFTDL